MPRRSTAQEKQKQVEKIGEVKRLVAEGMKPREAISKVGMTPSHFYTLRKRLGIAGGVRKYAPRAPKFETVPLQNHGATFELKGSPREIAAFIHELSQQYGAKHGE